ncbi:TPA: hypothetical protein H1011_00665 [archaeon]|jgi:hypothetical protein|uniref:Uncharacterized protein n=1 Tax=Candidatus Undinarchaeum marinum TaxID=2756141 RepID=A0A832UZK4_9ARCH|nr:hypothetical protein [Candidatus Undinarchaeum marinum]
MSLKILGSEKALIGKSGIPEKLVLPSQILKKIAKVSKKRLTFKKTGIEYLGVLRGRREGGVKILSKGGKPGSSQGGYFIVTDVEHVDEEYCFPYLVRTSHLSREESDMIGIAHSHIKHIVPGEFPNDDYFEKDFYSKPAKERLLSPSANDAQSARTFISEQNRENGMGAVILMVNKRKHIWSKLPLKAYFVRWNDEGMYPLKIELV